ncbi:unnamed protein product [Prorocentrum cordatum]|uniref:Tetratricopeptide repeat protein 38 n=1 Tax=Prorocentrum cordatum TaxID=2364126 RepID=A0ABN9QKY1_9DINO|nr:unnamed protein product [Polarella glacialis]
MGRVFMDINMDNLALRCFNKVLEPAEEAAGRQPLFRRHALLLKAICLLNEAEKDPKVEVPAGLALWARAEGLPLSEEAGALPLDQQIAQWEEEARPQGSGASGGGSSDLSVALGLLRLLEGPTSEAPRAFANALLASDATSDGCFSGQDRLAVKWNMLGAVMANRGRHEDALHALEQALRLNQHYPRALMNRSISQSVLGQHRQAAASCVTALGKIPLWSTDAVWAVLQQAVGRVDDGDELVEAVEKKNITQVRKLLAPELASVPKTDPEPDVAALLGKIGL